MKSINNFDDYLLDLIVETILTNEAPLIFSDRFKSVIKLIDHPISKKLLDSSGEGEYKSTFIDLVDDEDLDTISFITVTKAIQIIADEKGIDKLEKEKNVSKKDFIESNLNLELTNKLYSKYRSTTSVGKLINKLFPAEFKPGGEPGKDIQSFVNQFKSIRDDSDFELVMGYDIVKYYNENNYVKDVERGGTVS